MDYPTKLSETMRCIHCACYMINDNQQPPPIGIVWDYWENHVYNCQKQPLVDCGKGHKVKDMVLAMNGCYQCQGEVEDNKSSKDYRCNNPKCIAETTKLTVIDGDEDYSELQCKWCGSEQRINHPFDP